MSRRVRVVGLACAIGIAGAACAAPQSKRPRPATGPYHALGTAPPGTVVLRDGRPPDRPAKGAALRSGDLVINDSPGNVDLRLGEATVRVKPRVTLGLTRLPERGNPLGETRLKLDAGTILVRLRKLKGPARFYIETPGGVTAARGTSFLVRATPEKTEVLAAEGALAVTSHSAPGRELLLRANMKAVLVDGSVPPVAQPAEKADVPRVVETWNLPAADERDLATLTAIVRVVKVGRRQSPVLTDARVGMKLAAGYRLRTAGRSYAVLTYRDGRVLRVEELSEVEVIDAGRGLRLLRGRFIVTLPKHWKSSPAGSAVRG
jgi:hypothetical protein